LGEWGKFFLVGDPVYKELDQMKKGGKLKRLIQRKKQEVVLGYVGGMSSERNGAPQFGGLSRRTGV